MTEWPKVELAIGANPNRDTSVKVDGIEFTDKMLSSVTFSARAEQFTTVVLELAADVVMPEQQANVVFRLTGLRGELEELGRQISTEPDAARKDYLCAAYQALAWATMPNGHAPPSQMMRPATEGEKVMAAVAANL